MRDIEKVFQFLVQRVDDHGQSEDAVEGDEQVGELIDGEKCKSNGPNWGE